MRKKDLTIKWRRLAIVAGAGALCVYTLFALQGPHGVRALGVKWDQIQEMHAKQANLTKNIAEKRQRVASLEKGQDVEMEMRRFGRTLPGEIEYKVAEPDIPSPPEDKD